MFQAKSPRGVGRRYGWAVSQREHSINGRASQRLHDVERGLLWLFEMNGNRFVAPGVFELMAAIRGEHDFDAKFLRGVGEAAGLVAHLAGKEEKPPGRIFCHS